MNDDTPLGNLPAPIDLTKARIDRAHRDGPRWSCQQLVNRSAAVTVALIERAVEAAKTAGLPFRDIFYYDLQHADILVNRQGLDLIAAIMSPSDILATTEPTEVSQPVEPPRQLHPHGAADLTLATARPERDRLVDRTDVLDKVGVLRMLPDGLHATTEMVATFYEVDRDTTIRPLSAL